MNKIEELEKQLKEEMSKIQVDLKEKYKWIVGKYAKYNDSFITRIDDIHHIPMFSKNGYTRGIFLCRGSQFGDRTSKRYNL